MSSTSQPSIFPKSNLIYIPLSITIAHTINFMVNSPLSIWQEFPPKLPDSVYTSVFLTPFLLFISLTFEPIQTRKRFYILLSLAFIFVSIPLSYRKYPSALNNSFALTAAQYLLKMLLFLKFNRVYSNQKNSDQKKEFKSFLWSLFNWRFDSYIIPPQSKNSNEKENPLIIKSPTTSQINQKLISRLMLILAKWTIYELSLFISIKYMMEVPEEAYQIRLMKFVTKGTLPLTMTLMIECLSCTVLTYITLSLYYDAFTFIVTIIFRVFYSASEKNIHQNILIRLGVLTPSEYISLSEWIISFLFNTKHVFSEPWMSSSPRDFWSVRWQLLIKESLQELGYLPVKNLFISIVPKKVANMMGVLGAFLVSALLHEYIIIAQSDVWTGEHTFFFMMHGVVMILWEIVFGNENKNKNTKVQRFLKWVLLIIINLLLIPAFVEPIKIHCYLPSYFAHSNCKRI